MIDRPLRIVPFTLLDVNNGIGKGGHGFPGCIVTSDPAGMIEVKVGQDNVIDGVWGNVLFR